ncbi:Ig-like domain-containing protein [Cryobacterium adonitolivorans]|uniref:Ig-like domain-containing protein n=1 Tax=Cryobacterium adonitolivorans TaxID=1259189 RepID=UPI00141BE1E4|nr:Ig-like domain-containing protein [Cryobacterium adonitolivorans]
MRVAPLGILLAALLGAVIIGPLAGAATPASAAGTAPMASAIVTETAPAPPTEPAPTETGTPDTSPSPSESLAPSEAPAPSESPAPAPAAPTIDSPGANAFVAGSTTVTGTRDPGQEITLFSPTGGAPLCVVTIDGSSTWQCQGVALPSGPAVGLQAVVTGNSSLAAAHTVRVLQPPTVTGGSTGQASSNGIVRGTGYPGAMVTATLAAGASCSFTVDASGAWACQMQGAVLSGAEQITASQQTPFSAPESSRASEPVSLTFDVDAPAAPVVVNPVADATLATAAGPFYGQGENGATVTVFAGAYSVCSAVVSGGTWSCTGSGVANGAYNLRAVQQDAAGNVSAGSPAVRVTFGSVAPTPIATPTGAPTPTAAPPVVPAPTATAQPTPSATPGSASPTPLPAVPEDGDEQAGAAPPELTVPGGWNDPTQFSTAVIPPWTVEQFPWLQAAMLTLGALLLLVVPARLLAGTVTRARNGRPVFRGHRLAGRNRAGEEFDVAPTLLVNRWVVYGGTVAAAAVLVLLSGPVSATPAYLRLLLAVTLALVVVNAVATLVPQWWGSRALHVDVTTTILPRYLAFVAVTALASRLFELQPALLFGLLGSVVVGSGPGAAQRGQLAAIRAGSLFGLGLAALLVVGTLPVADGFLSALAAEVANTVVLASIGSAVLVLIPIGNTSGRSILAWSPPIWAALTVPAFLTLFTLLSPMLPRWTGNGTAMLLWFVAVGFAVLSVTAWAWQRFVLPTRR